MPRRKRTHHPVHFKKRFRNLYVKTDTCWVWRGATTEFGYGRFFLIDRLYVAHRISYVISVGPIPSGMQVLHSCDNPRCVNPEHLFLGTQSDNMKDCVAKNRHVGSTKLSLKAVLFIRTKKGRIPSTKLGKIFNVCDQAILDIWNNKTWRGV